MKNKRGDLSQSELAKYFQELVIIDKLNIFIYFSSLVIVVDNNYVFLGIPWYVIRASCDQYIIIFKRTFVMCSSRKYPCSHPPQRALFLNPAPPIISILGGCLSYPSPWNICDFPTWLVTLKKIFPSKMQFHYTSMQKINIFAIN